MNAAIRRIGVRDFRNSATQLIREVRECGSEFVITVDGEPVAVVRPFTREDAKEEAMQANEARWERMYQLRKEISAAWPKGLSAADAVSEQRR